jgi:hypothetical protein
VYGKVGMSVIYAKLKSDKAPTVILYNEDQVEDALNKLFNPPGLSNSIEYDCFGPQSLDNEIFHVDLSHEQWLKVQDVYETDNAKAADLPSSGYADQYVNIDVVYRVTGSSISFKKIRPSKFTAQQGIVQWGDRPVFEAPTEKVLIDPSVDVYVNKSSRRVYFKSFQTASRIVRVLNEFFEETAQQHAEEALSLDIFNIAEFDVAEVGAKNLKRLARIKGDLNIDLADASIVSRIQRYADKYERVDVFTDDRIKITSNAQLTEALDVISGAFYENEITGDVMKATSSKIV